jgi:hypothetical protein
MIEIFGPTYRYNNEILEKPEVIYINDHHYQEDTKQWHVKTLLENSSIDPQRHLLVFDHLHHDDVLDMYNHICFPMYITGETQDFINESITPDWKNKTYTFNFMINKPRISRKLLLVLIEKFKLENYTYSLPWKSNPYSKLAPSNYTFGIKRQLDQGVQQGSINNAQTYTHLLQKNIFEPSCISLITEPSFLERETMHTEKTIMSIYAGTLPIWVGGWRLASTLRGMGFDVFDDIIDHSYEHMEDPWDRAYYAIERNIRLLKDFKCASSFISDNQHRLRNNINLVETNPFKKVCEQRQKEFPQIGTLATFHRDIDRVLGR